MKSGKKRILIPVILLVIAAGVLLMLNIFQKNKWRTQELLSYQCSSGGGMNGGFDICVLSAVDIVKTDGTKTDDAKALLTFSKAEWHSQDPEVSEYFVNADALAEIKEIFLEEGMYRWDGKKFTNMFVADGESTGYRFSFTEDSVSFSSQIYPARYAGKLKKLDAVIQKYLVDAEKLPGLVLPEIPEDLLYSQQKTADGESCLQVYSYEQNCLSYRFLNGTDTELSLEGNCRLRGDDGRILYSTEGKKVYGLTVYPHSTSEESIKLTERLPAGTYVLEADGYTCEFEIR